METKRNKTLSMVLKALGILLTVGFIIALVGNALGWWLTPKVNGSGHYLFVILFTGLNLWLLGAIHGRQHNLDDAGMRLLAFHKGFFALVVLLALVDLFVVNPVIPVLDLSLSEIVNLLFGGLIGSAAHLLSRSRNRSVSR